MIFLNCFALPLFSALLEHLSHLVLPIAGTHIWLQMEIFHNMQNTQINS